MAAAVEERYRWALSRKTCATRQPGPPISFGGPSIAR